MLKEPTDILTDAKFLQPASWNDYSKYKYFWVEFHMISKYNIY